MPRTHLTIRADELAHLVEAIEDYAIFLLEPDGVIRSWNRGAARVLGYSADEVIGIHFSRFYDAEAIAARKPEVELETARRERRVEDEGWRLRKNGSRFWANTVITAIRDDAGQLIGFAKVTRDLTERRAAEERLRESEEIFRLIVQSVREYAIFLLDPKGNVLTWNAGARHFKGYEAEEIIGRHFSAFYPREDVAQRKPERLLEIAREKGSVTDEGWRVRKDGTRFWASVVITAVYRDNGELRGFAKVTRDLTERREAEDRLRQSEEIFRLLVQSVSEYAIFLLDPNGNVVTWNAGAREIKGYSADEIVGRHFSTFYPQEDIDARKPERELELAREHGSVEDEGWRIRKDGTHFWANVVITAVRDERGELRGFAKVTRDLTDRKHAEEMQKALFEQREARFLAEQERRRAEASYRASQEANRAKDEFLMTLSHELRTPLTSILGWARLLPTISPTDETFSEAVAAIARSAQLQARLIEDVLDVSRIVSGKLRLHVENVNVAELLTSAIDGVRPSADAKMITIAAALHPNLGILVADQTRLQQIVWNLLSNAVKFTPRGGRIDVAARRTTSHVEIEVRDDGEGIDPEFLPHVFAPFRQAENPSTRVHGGLGLGLSIVRYLTEAHGGSVTAESRGRGEGATFTVTLPVAAVATSEPARHGDAPTAVPQQVPQALVGRSVVLVDDDAEGRRLIATLLRGAGATVTEADSAPRVIDLLSRQRPDLVITDIAMPLVDGYALAREIRQRHPQLKIVALSAFPAGRSVHDSMFAAYITKPVEPAELTNAIARLVGA